MAGRLDSSIYIPVWYILCYSLAYFWPPVISEYWFIRDCMTEVSCSYWIIVCFQDPKVQFKGIGKIYVIVDEQEFIFDLVFPKRHSFVAFITGLEGFESFLCQEILTKCLIYVLIMLYWGCWKGKDRDRESHIYLLQYIYSIWYCRK